MLRMRVLTCLQEHSQGLHHCLHFGLGPGIVMRVSLWTDCFQDITREKMMELLNTLGELPNFACECFLAGQWDGLQHRMQLKLDVW